MKALAVLALLSGCAAQGLEEEDEPGVGPEVRFTAVVIGHTEIGGEGFCTGSPQATCHVYRLRLAQSGRHLPCPLIAVNDYDETGHRYAGWGHSVLDEKAREWELGVRRVREPYCHYSLVYTKRLDP